MAYKTIIVCLNEIARNPVLLDLTSGIAAKQEAHVIGLYVVPAVRVYPAAGPGVFTTVVEEFRDSFKARSAEVKEQFESHMARQTVQCEWRLVDSASPEIGTAVVEHALQSDLVIVSQVDLETGSGIEGDFAERVVMDSGRPVLVVPAYGNFRECGTRALVAWNGTRESARAAFDAVPLLKVCDTVQVVWMDPETTLDESDSLPGAELATALSRHGINVTAQASHTGGIGIGDALLSRASDFGADLLVMGAYGHSRTREYVFGGATRTVFDAMTVPVLMSH